MKRRRFLKALISVPCGLAAIALSKTIVPLVKSETDEMPYGLPPGIDCSDMTWVKFRNKTILVYEEPNENL